MKIYTHYIKPTADKDYISKLAFVNTMYTGIVRNIFYVSFENCNLKNGYYLDKNNYLHDLYTSIRFGKDWNSDPKGLYLKKSNGYISNIQKKTRYYVYVKVLEDKQNPQLEGEIMILQFGKKIMGICQNYLSHLNSETPKFQNIFKVDVSLVNVGSMRLSNYDKCDFIKEEVFIEDSSLDLNKEINFKTFDLISIQRKEKLLKIKQTL